MNINKLSLNIDNSNYMIFSSPRKTKAEHDEIKINDNIIEEIESTKFLGVIIDNKLNWNKHVNIAKSKIAKAIGIISKAWKCLSKHTLITLYYSFVCPHLLCSSLGLC